MANSEFNGLSEEERKRLFQKFLNENRYNTYNKDNNNLLPTMDKAQTENKVQKENNTQQDNRDIWKKYNSTGNMQSQGILPTAQKNNSVFQDIVGVVKNVIAGASSGIKQIGNYIENANEQNVPNYKDTKANQFLTSKKVDELDKATLKSQDEFKNNVLLKDSAKTSEDDRIEANLVKKVIQDSIQEDNKKIEIEQEKMSNGVTKKLGELAPSIGQMGTGMVANVVNPALGASYFFTSAGGGYIDEAKQRGMTDKQAFQFGTIMGGMESATELVGLENFKKAGIGLKSLIAGGKSAGKEVAKTSLKTVLKNYGIGVADNFIQEALIDPIQEVVASQIGGKDKANWENMPQQMLQDGINGALVAMITGGIGLGIKSCTSVAEKINSGKKVSQSEYKQAITDAQKGGVNLEDCFKTGTNQSVYKNTILNNLNTSNLSDKTKTELQQYLKENQITEEQYNQINETLQQEKMSKEEQSSVSDNEMKYQYIKSDNAKVNQLRQDVVNNNWDNSKETNNFVNFLEKIVTDKDVEIRLDANLKDNEGNVANGSYKDGVITINPNSDRSGEFLAVHELTHAIGTDEMRNMIQKYRESNSEFNNAVEKLLGTYKASELNDEALADISGQLFSSQDFINNVSNTNPSFFRKIYNEIKYLWHQFRGYKNQNQFVDDLYYKWTEAYNSNNKLNDTTNYHISENFSDEIDKALKNELPSNTQVKARDFTPKILVDSGVQDLPMLITQKHIKSTIYTQQEAQALGLQTKNVNYHGLGKELLIKAIDNLDSPQAIYKTSENNYLVVTEFKDNNEKEIIVPIQINGNGRYNDVFIDENQIKSVYGRNNLDNYINKNNFEQIYKKNKELDFNEGIQYSNVANSSIENSIASQDEDVNTTTKYSKQESENNSDSFNLLKSTKDDRKKISVHISDEKAVYKDKNGNENNIYFRFDNENGFKGKEHNSGIAGWEDLVLDEINNNLEIGDSSEGIDDTNSLLEQYGVTQKEYDNMSNAEQFKINQEIGIDKGYVTRGASAFELAQDDINFLKDYLKDHPLADYDEVNFFTGEENGYGADGEYVIIPDENLLKVSSNKIEKIIDDIEEKYEDMSEDEKSAIFVNEIVKIMNGDVKYSKENSTWREYLESHFKSTGTKTDMRKLPIDSRIIENRKQEILSKAQKIEKINPDFEGLTDEIKNSYLGEDFDYNTYKQMNNYLDTLQPVKKENNQVVQILPTNKVERIYENTPGEEVNYTEMERPNGKIRKHYRSIIESSNTTAEAKKIAKELMGMDTYIPTSNKSLIEQADRNIETNGAEQSLITLTTNVNNNEKIKAVDIATGERLIEYFSKIGDKEKLQEAIQTTAMAGTESGRAVQAMSMINHQTPQGQVVWIQRSIDKVNKRLAKERKNGAQFDFTPEMQQKILNSTKENLQDNINQVYEELGKQVPKSRIERLNEWRYFSMLANPRTHIRNIVGNLVMGKVQDTKNKIAGGLESVFLKGSDERTHTIKKASKEVRQFAKNDIKNVASELGLNDNKYNPQSRLQNAQRTFKSNVLENTLGKAFDFNSKLLEAEDGIGLKSAYIKALAEYITANKLDINNISDKDLQKARNHAIKQAQEATFHQECQLASMINTLENKNKVTQVLVGGLIPFKKTPINVAISGAQYSPVGLIASLTKGTADVRKGKISANQFIDNISKGLTGTGIALVGFALTEAGILKASGGDDGKDDYEEAQGKQVYSIQIGSNTYSLDWLTPAGIPLFVGSELSQLFKVDKESGEVKNQNQFISLLENIGNATMTAMNPMSEMSMVSGLVSTLKSYSQGPMQGLSNTLVNMGKSYVNQMFPTALGQVSKTLDDKERSTTSTESGILSKAVDSTKNQIISKIPGLRQMLPVATDIWGNEKKQKGNYIDNAILPWTKKEITTNSTDKALTELYDKTGESSVLPDSYINKTLTYDKQKYRLTDQEYAELKKEYGKTSYAIVSGLTKSSEFNKMSEEQQVKAVSEAYKYAKAKIKSTYASWNDIDTEDSSVYKKVQDVINNGGDAKDYFLYVGATADAKKEKEKVQILKNSNIGSKKAIYASTIGSDDKTYSILNNTDKFNINNYLDYKLQDFSSDKKDDGTVKGKTISGSGKTKFYNYMDDSNFTYEQKLLLTGMKYKTTNAERENIFNIINNFELSSKEKLKIMSKMQGFKVYNNGQVSF
jgi:hypothetical protein